MTGSHFPTQDVTKTTKNNNNKIKETKEIKEKHPKIMSWLNSRQTWLYSKFTVS